jgi:hypothetical protein
VRDGGAEGGEDVARVGGLAVVGAFFYRALGGMLVLV